MTQPGFARVLTSRTLGCVKVKICGLTNLDDAEESVRLGAWALGLNFHRRSPRFCEPDEAAAIGAGFRRRCEIVGVFVNPTLNQVAKAVENAQLSMVQLHGDEGPSFCTEVARRTGAKVIKAVHVHSAADVNSAGSFSTDYHLFDTRLDDLRGGTGTSFDWELLRGRHSKIPMILSGGLSPENVAEGVEVTRPFAVDVASGIETDEPGHKDHELLAAFFKAASPDGPDTVTETIPNPFNSPASTSTP